MIQSHQLIAGKCPYCREVNQARAVKCRKCGWWLAEPRVEPIWQFVLLSLFTTGLYTTIWFYRNWKLIKALRNLKISPSWRTIAFVVPGLGAFVLYKQIKHVSEIAKEVGSPVYYSPGMTAFGYVLLTLWPFAVYFFGHSLMPPTGLWLLSVLSQLTFLALPLLLLGVQKTLNAYWEKKQEGAQDGDNLTVGWKTLVILGVVFAAAWIR